MEIQFKELLLHLNVDSKHPDYSVLQVLHRHLFSLLLQQTKLHEITLSSKRARDDAFKQLEAVRKKATELQVTISKLQEDRQQQRQQFQTNCLFLTRKKIQCEELQQKFENSVKQLKENLEINKELVNTQEQLVARVKDVQIRLKEQIEINKREGQLRINLQHRIQQLGRQLKSFQQTNSELKKVVQQAEQNNKVKEQKLNEQIKTDFERKIQLSGKVDQLSQQLSQAASQLNSSKLENQNLKTLNSIANSEIQEKSLKIQKISDQFRSQIQSKQSVIKSLKQQLQQLQDQLRNCNQRLTSCNANRESLTTNQQILKNNIKCLEKQLLDASQRLIQQKSDLENKLTLKGKQLAQLSSINSTLENNYESARLNWQMKLKQSALIKEELLVFTTENASLKEKLKQFIKLSQEKSIQLQQALAQKQTMLKLLDRKDQFLRKREQRLSAFIK